jgi:predicted nucleotidyltransferase
MNLVEQNKKSVIALCKKHKVQELYVFGSVLTDRFNKKSDVDFLIQFCDVDPGLYFDNFMNLKDGLELLLERQVDLVENQAIRNPVLRKVIDREKVLIYE